MSVRFRLATTTDALRMTEFHNRYYRSRRVAGIWTWLYFGQHPRSAVFAYAESADGRVIATQGMVPYRLSLNGRLIESCKSENTLALPEVRGTGLMADLYEFAFNEAVLRGCQLIWGFTNSGSSFSRFGFDVHPIAATLDRRGKSLIRGSVQRLHADGPLSNRLLSSAKHLRDSLMRNRALVTDEPRHGHRIVMLDEAEAQLTWCHLRRLAQDGVQLSWEASYFNWRWVRNPTSRYCYVGLLDGSSVVAIAIITHAAGRVVISDVQANSTATQKAVILALVEHFTRSTGAFRSFTNTMSASGMKADDWGQIGFHTEVVTNLVVRAGGGKEDNVLKRADKWLFSFAWSEGIAS